MATLDVKSLSLENKEDHIPDQSLAEFSLSSKTIHADDYLNEGTDVAPPMHVSTTFRYDRNPDNLKSMRDRQPGESFDSHIYSRHTAPNTTRFEAILSDILKGPTLTYGSGLSAFHALLVFLNPKHISIGDGYHGCHGVIGIHQKLTGLKKISLDCPAEDLYPGDIVHVETPLNPTGTAYNLKAFAEKAHSRGAFLTVDATFGPPPLQDPFLWGADIVLHSGTKYVGGHSDMLCGILAVNPKREGWFEKLSAERVFIGNVMGNMEGWLGIRSVRTLEIRVERQAANAAKLVTWLDDALHPEKDSGSKDGEIIRKVLAKIEHASLQAEDIKDGWLTKQMPNGFGPVFSICLKDMKMARQFPSTLKLFHHATSLGGVESLIEWRSMSDSTVDTSLLRISIGLEGWEDLRDDLLQGFKALAAQIE
ncbi:related to cystathionine gamma-synthases [Rhynchosporium agropyri]|uniref:Related to cystathionine gamma-synthases n=2 Tax=Rhynchosporium TaxID=38037 RepID=A0A1E1K8Q1_9HELO|nr:related to cystathionine gamma-synthases [Rhynchosporium agropyri]CZT01533.1 related to cystathionine gamma-synthases [Rhynchosporium commune]